MAKQNINIGTSPNDGRGDPLRTAGQKINSNFTEVYNASQAAFDTANAHISMISNTDYQVSVDSFGVVHVPLGFDNTSDIFAPGTTDIRLGTQNHHWSFYGDGTGLKFPDDSIQTTAYTGGGAGTLRFNNVSAANVDTTTVVTEVGTEGANIVKGPSSWDDDFFSIELPWNFTLFGSSYDTVFVGSNSYLTFGAGTWHYEYGANVQQWIDNLQLPGIFLGANDNSYQTVYTRQDNHGSYDTFTIRYEGNDNTSGTPGSSSVIWEVTFFSNDPTKFTIYQVAQRGNTSESSYFLTDGARAIYDFRDQDTIPAVGSYFTFSTYVTTVNGNTVNFVNKGQDKTTVWEANGEIQVNVYTPHIGDWRFDAGTASNFYPGQSMYINATGTGDSDPQMRFKYENWQLNNYQEYRLSQQTLSQNNISFYVEAGNNVVERSNTMEFVMNNNDGIYEFNGTVDRTKFLFPLSNSSARTGYGNVLKLQKTNNQKIIATENGTVGSTTVERLVISGGDSYYDGSSYPSGEAGDIYLWAGRGFNGGDIKVDAGQSYGSYQDGGNIKIRGGNSANGIGGFIEIRAGNGDGSQGTGGPIYVYANNHQFVFNADAGLQFPDATIQTTAYTPYKPVSTIGVSGITSLSLLNEVVFCDPNAAEGYINLVLPDTLQPGKVITVKNINTGIWGVYVQPSSASTPLELLNGTIVTSSYETISTTGKSVSWICDGTTWRIFSSHTPA